jgi:hypothetical protein
LPFGAYLIEWLFELGIVLKDGSGHAPLSFTEINAWAQLMDRQPQPWEVRALRLLSGVYVSALHEGQDPNQPPPWAPAPVVFNRAELASRLSKVFSAKARVKPQG